MEKGESTTKDATKTISKTLNLLQLRDGWICKSNDKYLTIHTIWSLIESSSQSNIFVSKIFSTNKDIECSTTPTPKPGVTAVHFPTSRRAHLFYCDDGKKYFIDIWNDHTLLRRFDLLRNDLHGKVYTHMPEFSALYWSPCGNKLIYLAERKCPKPCSFYHQNNSDSMESRTTYDYIDNWGEELEDYVMSDICILDIVSEEIRVLKNIPEGVFCSKPSWSTNDMIYFIGMNTKPFKIGARYNTSTVSKLYSYDLRNNKVMMITNNNNVVMDSHPEPDGRGRLVFSTFPQHSLHSQGSYRIICVFWPKSFYSERPTVNAKEVPGGFITTVPNFNFCGWLSPAPWVDTNHIVIIDIERWKSVLYKLNILTGIKEPLIDDLNPQTENMSFDVAFQYKSLILFSCGNCSSFMRICQKGLGYIHLNTPNILRYIIPPEKCDMDCENKPMEFTRDGRTYNGIFIKANEGPNLKTLIVVSHGGPSYIHTTEYSARAHVLCKLGYSMLMINYTGSLGTGPDSIDNLCGNIGDMDVKDVHSAAMEVGKDFDHIIVMGSSHGGFISAHLVGQYPGSYSAACLLNPVIDIAMMAGSSDSPDWCYYTSGLQYNYHVPQVPSAADLKVMLDNSPIRYVDKVKAPVLMLLGSKDRRVPPSQSIRYYQYLKARNVPCEIKMYPNDCHGLTSVSCVIDSLMQMHLFFKKHLKL